MTVTTNNVTHSILTFRLGQQDYGLMINEVVEVAAMVEVTKIAGAPPALLGVVNRHGVPIPLLDLRIVLGQPSASVGISTLFIVAQFAGKLFGLVVDEVLQVEYAGNQSAGNTRYIEAIVSQNQRLIQVISLRSVLTAVLPGEIEV